MVMAGVIHRGVHCTNASGAAALWRGNLNGKFLPRRVSTRIEERRQSSYTRAWESTLA